MDFDDLRLGQMATLAKTITEADLLLFSAVSMDTNPLHVDAEAAAGSVFKERTAHAMLSAGLIGALLGTRLPGPGSIHVSQNLLFRRPVRIGATVTASAEVTALDPRTKHVTLRTECRVAGRVVTEGEAVVIAPHAPVLEA